MLKIGDRVNTEFGLGTIVGRDIIFKSERNLHKNRWMVKLDNNPESFQRMGLELPCFHTKELTKVEDRN